MWRAVSSSVALAPMAAPASDAMKSASSLVSDSSTDMRCCEVPPPGPAPPRLVRLAPLSARPAARHHPFRCLGACFALRGPAPALHPTRWGPSDGWGLCPHQRRERQGRADAAVDLVWKLSLQGVHLLATKI